MAKTWTCYIWGEGDRGDRQYSVFDYFPFKPMKISSMTIRVQHWEGDSHVTDTEQNIFSINTIFLGYRSSEIENNTVRQNTG